MPLSDPQIGEVWSTTDAVSGRDIQGILAELAPARAVFVSLSGQRFPVTRSRLGSSWRFVSAALTRPLPQCQRTGCTHRGMIRYTRPDTAGPEFACPRHVPFNVGCQIAPTPQDSDKIEVDKCRASPCPKCGNADPAEDPQLNALPCRMWWCPLCRARWVTVPRAEGVRYGRIARLNASLTQYRMESIHIFHQDTWGGICADWEVPLGFPEGTSRVSGVHAMLDQGMFNETVRSFFDGVCLLRQEIGAKRPVQRLGGAPSQGSTPSATPALLDRLYHPTRPQAAALHRLRQQEEAAHQQQAIFGAMSRIAAIPSQEVYIDTDSLWSQRTSGTVVVVTEVRKQTDGSESIRFRQSTHDDRQPTVSMTREDFLLSHKLCVAGEAIPPQLFDAAVEEEWEHIQDRSSIVITEIDTRREVIHGKDIRTGRTRQIPFVQFSANKWQKIVRRSIYDRLRRPDLDSDK